VRRVRVEDHTVTRRPLAVALVPLLALPALAGCAAAGNAAEATPRQRAASASAAVQGPVAPAALREPCATVDANEVSLYVALANWQVTTGSQDGRLICQFTANGFVVTTVTMRLADPSAPPAGLCGPLGATGLPPSGDLLCGYQGPKKDSATMVVAGGGVAVGVRVTGPDAQRYATVLAEHALTHL
jgi:hypothetical protein